MFRRRQEQLQKNEPEFTKKSDVELSIGELQDKRDAEVKEGLEEIEAEKKKKNYKITLHFVGGGAPAGPGTRAVELSEDSREMIASGMMQAAEADDFKTTPTGIDIMFNGRMLASRKEAIMFGKEKMDEIETDDSYKYTVTYDKRKGQDGVEVMSYD